MVVSLFLWVLIDNNMNEKEIVENIKKSKKYKAVYIKTIERVVADCINRFGEKRAEKEAKNLLHQVWGAFKNSGVRHLEILQILKQHSSTKERISILPEFYKKIFEITGIPNSIIDHACGLNPLTKQWMNLPASKQGGPENCNYKAYDIDQEEIEFLKSMGVDANLGDILCDEFMYADVVFMLKLLPCLEHQKKNCSLEILKNQKCKYIVVSYPIKSIGGKNKGMTEFYRKSFTDLVKNEKWGISELLFDTELVFIIKK